jgi:Mrp family chromosome partitioning ATPase
VDGVLLVLFSGKTDSKTANRSMDALERVSANIIGTVVTDVDYAKHYGYYRYYRYYYQYYHHYGAEGEKDGDA